MLNLNKMRLLGGNGHIAKLSDCCYIFMDDNDLKKMDSLRYSRKTRKHRASIVGFEKPDGKSKMLRCKEVIVNDGVIVVHQDVGKIVLYIVNTGELVEINQGEADNDYLIRDNIFCCEQEDNGEYKIIIVDDTGERIELPVNNEAYDTYNQSIADIVKMTDRITCVVIHSCEALNYYDKEYRVLFIDNLEKTLLNRKCALFSGAVRMITGYELESPKRGTNKEVLVQREEVDDDRLNNGIISWAKKQNLKLKES